MTQVVSYRDPQQHHHANKDFDGFRVKMWEIAHDYHTGHQYHHGGDQTLLPAKLVENRHQREQCKAETTGELNSPRLPNTSTGSAVSSWFTGNRQVRINTPQIAPRPNAIRLFIASTPRISVGRKSNHALSSPVFRVKRSPPRPQTNAQTKAILPASRRFI